MANTTNSPNMLLPIPVVGQDPGPQFATDINNCLTLVDGHDHTPGRGVQLTPSSFNINSDLPLNNNNLTLARALRFQVQSSTPALAADLGELYVTGVDLFYIDVAGNNVRLTQNGNVAGTSGSIANLTSPAAATYVSATSTFVWQSDTNTPANMDNASVTFRNLVANSHGVTLSAPSSLGADYALMLPTLPSANSVMSLDASGNMGSYTLDAQTLAITSGVLGVKTSANIPGKAVKEQGLNVIVSNTNAATNSLAIVRGKVDSHGTVVGGEGFSVTQTGAGNYTIHFNTDFLDTPVIVVSSADVGDNTIVAANATSVSNAFVVGVTPGGSAIDTDFNFIAIGQRA